MFPGTANNSLMNSIQNTLQTVLSPTVITGYPLETPMFMEISGNPTDDIQFFNNQIFIDLRTQPLYTYGTDPLSFMNPGILTYQKMSVSIATQNLSVPIPELTMLATNNKKGAIASVITEMYTSVYDGYTRTMNLMMLGNAGVTATPTNVIATTSGSGSATTSITITIDADRMPARYFAPYQYIQVVGMTGGSLAGGTGTLITGVANNGSTATLTVQDVVTFANAANITFLGKDGKALLDYQGIGTFTVTSGNIQNLATTAFTGLPHVYTTPGAFSGPQLLKMIESVQQGRITDLICNNTQYQNAAQSVINEERTGMADQALLDIGYANVSVMGGTIKLIKDFDVPYANIYGFDRDVLCLPKLKSFGLISWGSPIQVPGLTTVSFDFTSYGNMVVRNPEPLILYGGLS